MSRHPLPLFLFFFFLFFLFLCVLRVLLSVRFLSFPRARFLFSSRVVRSVSFLCFSFAFPPLSCCRDQATSGKLVV